MTLKAVILLKNRKALIKKLNPKHTHFKFQKGLYVISEADINNVKVGNKIKGAEIIYFEGNPNALSHIEPKEGEGEDRSSTYLDDIVYVNALKQTSESPRISIGDLLAPLGYFKDPMNWVYLVFIGSIIYGVLAQVLGWV